MKGGGGREQESMRKIKKGEKAKRGAEKEIKHKEVQMWRRQGPRIPPSVSIVFPRGLIRS